MQLFKAALSCDALALWLPSLGPQDLQRKLAATRRQLDEASAKVRALTEQDKRRSEAEEERVQEHVRQVSEGSPALPTYFLTQVPTRCFL